jgi:sulfane dehydrogenase subunit SoxC
VEVSVDDGDWKEAELGDPVSPSAWRPWSYEWHADSPGRHELRCRASDASGNDQPLDPPWNLGGYANNSAQRVMVNVGSADR